MSNNFNCRICGKKNFELIIDLGDQPWGNHFLKKSEIGSEPKYPLRLIYCLECGLPQLDFTVKKEIMFGNHTYLSGITKTLEKHFLETATNVSKYLPDNSNKNILDIGSNDGTLLKQFKKLGFKVLGFESSTITADLANNSGIQTINEFFNYSQAVNLNQKFDVINAAGVFYHLEELHSVTEGIKLLLKENGIFVIHFVYMKTLVDNCAFDQIYHEHLLYYNLNTLKTLLNLHNLEIFDYFDSDIHGGSLIAFVCHKNKRNVSKKVNKQLAVENKSECNSLKFYKFFAENIKRTKRENLIFLEKNLKLKKKIFGFGAPVKGNTLINYFGITKNDIPYLIEKNKLRRNMYSPGSHIPVKIEDEFKEIPDIYYVLAWNFKKEILNNNKDLINKGIEFYFPINF